LNYFFVSNFDNTVVSFCKEPLKLIVNFYLHQYSNIISISQ
jgi:hypothetical protein